MTHRSLLTALALFFLAALPAKRALADPIYQWTDEAGQTHYSTTPDNPKAKAAKLPELRHEDIDENIRKLQAETPESCEKHGGPDCAQGADQDGSVVCLDGFRDARLPFRFQCLEARLKSEMMVKTAGDGEFVKHSSRELQKLLRGRGVEELLLSVRNLTGVEAFGMKAEIRLPGKAPIPLDGPEKIDAFGQADYLLPAKEVPALPIRDIEQARYRISCTNCATVLGRN